MSASSQPTMASPGQPSDFEPADQRIRLSTLLAGAFLVLATLTAYWPAMQAGFIWDDEVYLTENPLIKAPNGLARIWFSTEPEIYYPLSFTSLWLEWRLWGPNPMGYHVTNILLHAANACLVWRVLKQWNVPGAWFAALIFALHPVNVSSVAWISERKNMLSLLFCLLAVRWYWKSGELSQSKWYLASIAAFLLALLSKTAVVMLPAVLLLSVWWRGGGIVSNRADWLRIAPFFLLSLVLGLVTIWFEHTHAAGAILRTVSLPQRITDAGCAAWFYLGKTLLPVRLSMIYPGFGIDPHSLVAYVPMLALLAFLGVCWQFRREWGKAVLVGFGSSLLLLLPVLGFVNVGFHSYSPVADHWQYAAMIGTIALFVAVIARLLARWPASLRIATVAVAVILLGAMSWSRCWVFQNGETLWRDTLAKNPKAWVAYHGLGRAAADQGRLDEAARHYHNALRLNPAFDRAHNSLGVVLSAQGKHEAAMQHFAEAIRCNPRLVEPYNNLGMEFLRRGDTSRARDHFSAALALRPTDANALNGMGATLLHSKPMEAIPYFERALKTKPYFAEAQSNLGAAFAALNRPAEAVRHYSEAVRLKPDDADAHNNLGVCFAQAGRLAEAVQHFQEALRLKPAYTAARQNLDLAQRQRAQEGGGQ